MFFRFQCFSGLIFAIFEFADCIRIFGFLFRLCGITIFDIDDSYGCTEKTVKSHDMIYLLAYFRRSHYLLTIPEIAIIAKAKEECAEYAE